MRILIITAPISSNLLASIKLAKFLSQNNLVFYATSSPAFDVAVLQGFRAFELLTRPFVNTHKRYGFLNRNSKIRKDYLLRSQEFLNIFETCKPDVVYLDTFAGPDLLFIKEAPFKVKVIYIHPMLSLSPSPNFHGFEKDSIGISDWISRSIWSNTGRLMTVLSKVLLLEFSNLLKVLYGARTTTFAYAKEKFVSFNIPLDLNIKFTLISRQIPQLILAPSELEYPTTHFRGNERYLGLCIGDDRKGTYDLNFDFAHLQDLQSKYRKVVYVSFGMFGSRKEDKLNAEKFISSIIEVADQLTDFLFIISTASKVNHLYLPNSSSNIKFYYNVPQIQVLEIASIFICHGGLGSIKEAIFTKTPLIICVLDGRFDQKGNSLKVEYHGIGVNLGQMREVGPSQVLEAISMLANDLSFGYKIASFSEDLEEKYNIDFWEEQIEYSLANAYQT